MCSLMLGELPSLGPALSQCPLYPWMLGGALSFVGTSVRIPLPSSQVPMLCLEPLWVRVWSSW